MRPFALLVLAACCSAAIRVIGHYPEYIKLAEELGEDALVFNVSSQEWDSLEEAHRWEMNKKWLDEGVATLDAFRLATNPLLIRRNSYLHREIDYLLEAGYEIYLLKPPASCNGTCVLVSDLA